MSLVEVYVCVRWLVLLLRVDVMVVVFVPWRIALGVCELLLA